MGTSSRGASATSSHLEVERKFEVIDSTVTPSFDGLASIAGVERAPTQTLHAVYYDTPGRDLAAHHITLRRRTGGTDAGWHLKLPSGPAARTEVRTELGRGGDDEVPAELRDVVLAIVRDRPLVPAARIGTIRTSMCCLVATAMRSRSFATTRSPPGLTVRRPNSVGGNGKSSWLRTRSPGVAPMGSCWRG